jgi:hypothetical protein
MLKPPLKDMNGHYFPKLETLILALLPGTKSKKEKTNTNTNHHSLKG